MKMIEQDYYLLGSKPWRIKLSDEHVGARTTPLGYAARLKQKIQCLLCNMVHDDFARMRESRICWPIRRITGEIVGLSTCSARQTNREKGKLEDETENHM
jgi:hypothetical protein